MSQTQITSRQNPLIVKIASLHEKKYREEHRLFLIEGKKLFSEALQSGLAIKHIFATEQALSYCMEEIARSKCSLPNDCLICVSQSVFEKISTEKSPQGVLCVAEYLDKSHIFSTIYNDDVLDMKDGRIFILSSLRDPGNLGTVIRTCRAFGIHTLILSSDCADLYSPKTVRSAMGTLFRQKIRIVPDLPDAIKVLRASGKKVYAAMLDESSLRLDMMQVDKDTVFIVGNEGHGIEPEIAGVCTGSVMIPMEENAAESLNAAIASAILLWQGFTS